MRNTSHSSCWHLADTLRQKLFALTVRFQHDFKRRAQMEDTIDSVCRNIAEGFGCPSHAEFARYLEIARRSLNELMDCLRSARLKSYISPKEFNEIEQITRRLYPALNKLIAYLRRGDTDGPRDRTDRP